MKSLFLHQTLCNPSKTERQIEMLNMRTYQIISISIFTCLSINHTFLSDKPSRNSSPKFSSKNLLKHWMSISYAAPCCVKCMCGKVRRHALLTYFCCALSLRHHLLFRKLVIVTVLMHVCYKNYR